MNTTLEAIQSTWIQILAKCVSDPNNEEYYIKGVDPEVYSINTVKKMMNNMLKDRSSAKGALSRNPSLKKAAQINGIKTAQQWDILWGN